MSESVILKMLVGLILAGIFGLNAKIVWDWLTRYRVNSSDVTNIKDNLERLTEKIDKLSSVVVGNGDPEISVVFRLAKIEEFMKEIKKKKESLGL